VKSLIIRNVGETMGQLKEGVSYIYESPDGGETIYARESGGTERHLISISLKRRQRDKELADRQLWDDIRKQSETNEALKTALEHCILLYYIGKNGS
jgi:hypothetical protein